MKEKLSKNFKKHIAILIALIILFMILINIINVEELKIDSTEHISKQKIENTVNYSQLKVGDYVSYDPKKGVTDETLLTYTIDEKTYNVQDGTKWRVLNMDEQTGKIELISTEPAIEYCPIGGTDSYLYLTRDLNRLCSIYGYGYGADRKSGTIYTIGGAWEKEINIKILGTAGRALNVDDVNKLHNIGEERNGTTITTKFKDLNPEYGEDKHYEILNMTPDWDVDLEGSWITPAVRGSGDGNMIDVRDTCYSYNISSDLINSELLASTAISTKPIGEYIDNYQKYELYIGYCVRVINNGKVNAEPVGVCVDGGDTIDIPVSYSGTQAIVRLKKDLKFYLNSDLEPGGTESNPWQIQ